MTHWASQYIGKPWEAGAHGPDAYDCYGLAVVVERDHFNRQLPLIAGIDPKDTKSVAEAMASDEYRSGWTPIDMKNRRDGDLVLMAHSRFASHIGIWLDVDGGGILHITDQLGVMFQSILSLRSAGWGHLQWFTHE